MSIEREIANAVLQNDIEVNIGAKAIKVPRPTLGTMMEVSKIVSECGFAEFKLDVENALSDTLKYAKESDKLAEILAMFIIGRKNAVTRLKIFGMNICIRDRVKRLKIEILDNLTPHSIATALAEIFKQMDCAFFLGIITTLSQVNILRKTTT